MSMKKHLFLFLHFIAVALSVMAQQTDRIVVTGRVTDSSGEPLTAVLVNVDGTDNVVYTDIDGKYAINTPTEGTLTFAQVGYVKQKHPVKGRRTMDITMMETEATKMEELVVVGYSRVERRDLTGSVSSAKLPEVKPFLSFDQMLAGQAAGVFVSGSSGALGSANLLTIRGISSILGDNNPLYVIDGVPMYGTDRQANSSSTTGGMIDAISMGGNQVGGGSLNYNSEVLDGIFERNPLASINPEDIESIEILKDAFATAIYGSRGTAGVVLITTKKGSREKTQVNVSYNLSVESPIGKHLLLNGPEYAMIYSHFLPGQSFPTGHDTDWVSAVTRTAVSHNTAASVSGGTNKTNYFLSLAYNDNQSYIINNALKRYSARANLDTELHRDWKMGFSLSLSRINNNAVAAPAVYGAALIKAPNLPVVRKDNGDYHYGYLPNTKGSNAAYNPVAMAYINRESIGDIRTLGHVYLEFKPLSGVVFRTEAGTDLYHTLTSIRKGELPKEISTSNNQAQETVAQYYKFVLNNTLNVNKIIGSKHHLQGVLGQSYEYANEYTNSVAGNDFFSPHLTGVGAAREKRVISSGRQEWALFSAFTRLNWQYDRRYLLGFTWRIDGSSRFNKNNRYLSTPSIAAGWRLSEEDFVKRVLGRYVDEMKLRASLGWSSKDGNSSYYGAQAVYTLSPINYGGRNFLVMSQPGNRNLGWEKAVTLDVGLDLSLMKNRLELTLDYYRKKTVGMLFPSDLPLYTGYRKQQQNIADMMNEGIEAKLLWHNVRTSEFQWQSILNLSYNRNRILKLNFHGNQLEDLNSSTKYYAEGQPVAQFYLHRWEGVDPATGNPLWRYTDGTLSTVPPGANLKTAISERSVQGKAMPDVYGGLTNNIVYKRWELGFLFSFAVGGKLMNSTRAHLLTYSTDEVNNLSKSILTMWQLPGQQTDIPKLRHESIVGAYDYAAGIGSTRFLEDASYLRLKTLELAYNVSSEWLRKTRLLTRLRVYALMTNVFTLTPYTGIDPEVSAFGSSAIYAGYDNLTMPQTRSIQLGLRASF